jgi:GT2 family glycosyltransferase
MEAHRSGLNCRSTERLAGVVIGRNEGQRLVRCLESLRGQVAVLVYVDSGSTDGSVETARALGADVVCLDLGLPFTAARARNAGRARLRQLAPDEVSGQLVQFVDGDCEVSASWLNTAVAFLDTHQDVAVVCGRRRERMPERSIYNHLCDLEWDTPVGETRACGGDALMRLTAFDAVGGYRDSLIAGEEPELCVRLRAAGWRIYRIDAEMTLHDAAMERFTQWWNRTRRSGYAFAEGAALHGGGSSRHWVNESRRALLWGLLLPLSIIAIACVSAGWGLLLALIYPLQMLRLLIMGKRTVRDNLLQACFHVLGRFPEAFGVLTYWYRRQTGAASQLIEYK